MGGGAGWTVGDGPGHACDRGYGCRSRGQVQSLTPCQRICSWSVRGTRHAVLFAGFTRVLYGMPCYTPSFPSAVWWPVCVCGRARRPRSTRAVIPRGVPRAGRVSGKVLRFRYYCSVLSGSSAHADGCAGFLSGAKQRLQTFTSHGARGYKNYYVWGRERGIRSSRVHVCDTSVTL